MTHEPLYQLDGLGRVFMECEQRVEALVDVSRCIHRDRLIAICGPSGAGKSTLLQILGLLDEGYAGRLSFAGKDVRELTAREMTRLRLERIGFVFQRHHLVEAMSVLENVAWPHWRLHGNRQEAYRRARLLLEELGMAHREKHFPIKLSGGELQRVALARAVVNRPSVILADEPTAQLDQENATTIVELFLRLVRQGHSVLAVTHDAHLISAAHETIRLRYGRLIFSEEASS